MKKQELLDKLKAMPSCLFTKEQVIEMVESIEQEDTLLQKVDPIELRMKAEEILLLTDKDFYIDYDKMDFTLDLDRRVCVMGVDWLNLDYIIMRIVDTMRLKNPDLFEYRDIKADDEIKGEKGIPSDMIESEDDELPKEKGITADMIESDSDDINNALEGGDNMTFRGDFPERVIAPTNGSIIYPYDPDADNPQQTTDFGKFDINPENL